MLKIRNRLPLCKHSLEWWICFYLPYTRKLIKIIINALIIIINTDGINGKYSRYFKLTKIITNNCSTKKSRVSCIIIIILFLISENRFFIFYLLASNDILRGNIIKKLKNQDIRISAVGTFYRQHGDTTSGECGYWDVYF